MLFNSISFLLFFPIVCLCYFAIPAEWLRARNGLLLGASFYFYMNWEPAYAMLLLLCIVITWGTALGIGRHDAHGRGKLFRKCWLVVGIMVNLSVLFLFKYYNFITAAIADMMHSLGMSVSMVRFQLLLPVGISFYTFQALGYSIDVYRGKLSAERHFPTYALYVSFFPQLVAGPIERSTHLLPQFRERHAFNYGQAMEGLRLMMWGYFMKLVVADRCGLYVDAVFNNMPMHNGGSYLLASLLFPFQIYGDFAGYSLIAIGASRVMGFRLMDNFRRPYFSSSVGEFWHRWHISLSTWFRDYVYIPLGGNRVSRCRNYLNLMATFTLSGLWHGANWTFLFWGMFHGGLLCIEKRLGIGGHDYRGMSRLLHCLLTFVLVSLGWVLFRAGSVGEACTVLSGIVIRFGMPELSFAMFTEVTTALAAIAVLVSSEYAAEHGWALRLTGVGQQVAAHAVLLLLAVAILLFGVLDGGQFIYFQF